MSEPPVNEIVARISPLRESLGIACHHVANHNEPIIAQQYKLQNVTIVPVREWRWRKRIEQARPMPSTIYAASIEAAADSETQSAQGLSSHSACRDSYALIVSMRSLSNRRPSGPAISTN